MSANTVFISTSFDNGWVIEKIAARLHETLGELGVKAGIGPETDYRGEPIVFQARFLYARPFPGALVNSLFVTHIDDRLKEFEVRGLRRIANSYVCLSPEDAAFLVGLGVPAEQVTGLDLPLFDRFIEPLKLCVFSKRYTDGRKNEAWLLKWAERNPASRSGIYFSLVGSDWFPFAERLEGMGWSVEVVSLNRQLCGEYEIQLRTLRSAHAYLYMGFDGGALGSYDAFKARVPLYVSKTSYHHGIPGPKEMFENEEQFHTTLDRLAADWRERQAFADSHSMTAYTKQLLGHWAAVARLKLGSAELYPAHLYASQVGARSAQIDPAEAVQAYRGQHQSISLFRFLGSSKRLLRRLF